MKATHFDMIAVEILYAQFVVRHANTHPNLLGIIGSGGGEFGCAIIVGWVGLLENHRRYLIILKKILIVDV